MQKVVLYLSKIASTLEKKGRPDYADYVSQIAASLEKGIVTSIVAQNLIAAEETCTTDAADECGSIEAAKKREKKWIQKAVPEETEGDFTAWCKNQGFKGVCQGCINKAVDVGGRPQKMALFAVNVSKGKYTYPKK